MARQAHDYANPDQSGPNAGYMTFDPDPAVRRQQDDQIEQNLASGGRGLGQFVWGGLTGNRALASDGLRRYAEATGLVDPETVDAAAGGFSAAGSGTGARPGPVLWPYGPHNITIARRILELVLGGHELLNGGPDKEEVV